MEVREEKNRLRQVALEFRNQLSPDKIQQLSTEIWRRLVQFPPYQSAKTVMFYVALPGEVDTKPMIQESLQLGKRIIVPVTDKRTKTLLPCEIFGLHELVSSTFNVLEPPEHLRRVVPAEDIDLIIVPGLSFDLRGGRVGFGAGYYDRFLAQPQLRATTVALSFHGQLVERVPQGEHDVTVDYIVTERGSFQCASRSSYPEDDGR